MRISRIALLLALIAGVADARTRRPYIGYLCAAGGQRGTTVRVIAGGQSLRGATQVLVSGKGVHAKVIRFRRPPWLLTPDERRAVAQGLRQAGKPKRAGRKGSKKEPLALPDHPLLENLDALTPKELRRLGYEFLDPRRRSQLSAQIAETVELEIVIDRNAEPGDRELRIRTPRGLTNPVLFQVGTLPEFREQEPNDYRTTRQPTVDSPCVINGQVSFRDLDRFRFRAKQRQRLVIEAQARRLVPYLADAVPGWFQATLAIRDADGRELRFVDDHRFEPDPVLLFEVPEDGDYILEIRDAIHRGREDFVYRVTVAERPFVLAMFPLGGRKGSATTARIDGWNLDGQRIRLGTRRGTDDIRETIWRRADLCTNGVLYAVGDLPERIETEPNDGREQAQLLPLPSIVNGRISRAGECDWYRFRGRVGQEAVVEVHARRLGSSLDSLVKLTDAAGHIVAWNDDHPDRSAGLVTHQADSYLRAKLLATETYYVCVADAQGHGGDSFAYRLRVSRPRPDFVVIATPASVNVPAGGAAAVTVHVVRRDGFDGEIELSLPESPRQISMDGERIPAGRDRIRMTLSAPPGRRGPPVPIDIVARAKLGGRPVRRRVVAAEDMMQAFGLRHLVPSKQLYVDVTGVWRKVPRLRRKDDRLLKIASGNEAELEFSAASLPALADIEFKLVEPPAGIKLDGFRKTRDGLALRLVAEQGTAVVDRVDNLLIEAHLRLPVPRRAGKAAKGPATRQEVVLLPAVPFVVSAD
jgi:hypothetical protein